MSASAFAGRKTGAQLDQWRRERDAAPDRDTFVVIREAGAPGRGFRAGRCVASADVPTTGVRSVGGQAMREVRSCGSSSRWD